MSGPAPLPVDAPELPRHPLISIVGWRHGQTFNERYVDHVNPAEAFDAALDAVNRQTARLFVMSGIWPPDAYRELLCGPDDAETLAE